MNEKLSIPEVPKNVAACREKAVDLMERYGIAIYVGFAEDLAGLEKGTSKPVMALINRAGLLENGDPKKAALKTIGHKINRMERLIKVHHQGDLYRFKEAEELMANLEMIERELEKYPAPMLKIMQEKGLAIVPMQQEHKSGHFGEAKDSLDLVHIATNESPETLHHELFHFFDWTDGTADDDAWQPTFQMETEVDVFAYPEEQHDDEEQARRAASLFTKLKIRIETSKMLSEFNEDLLEIKLKMSENVQLSRALKESYETNIAISEEKIARIKNEPWSEKKKQRKTQKEERNIAQRREKIRGLEQEIAEQEKALRLLRKDAGSQYQENIEELTGCYFDPESQRFTGVMTEDEYRTRTGREAYEYYAKWSQDPEGQITMDHHYWNAILTGS